MQAYIVWGALALAAALAAWFFWSLVKGRPWTARQFFFRSVVKFMFKSPELITNLGILEKVGINGHNRKWSDPSTAGIRKTLGLLKREHGFLASYRNASLKPDDRISLEALEAFERDVVEGERFFYQDFPLNQLSGPQLDMPNFMANIHPVNNVANAKNYAIRLARLPEYCARLASFVRDAEASGCVPPRFAVEKALAQTRELLAKPADEHPMLVSFKEKAAKLKVSEKKREALVERVRAAVTGPVAEGYRLLEAALAGLLPKAVSNDGAWRLPSGAEYYAHRLESSTTTTMGAEEIHAKGLAETERLEREIGAILDELGIASAPTLGARMKKLAEDQRFYYPDTDEGRKRIVADYAKIIEDVQAKLPGYFERLPKAKVEVLPVPEIGQANAPGGYYQPSSMGGDRPGRFFVNLYDLKANPKYGMKTLAYHEAIPGHHFQIALSMERKGMPLFRRFGLFTAYIEGWALYAERLAREMGMYSGDREGLLGSLLAEHFRAVRLVVDTGLHAKRWSREKAIAYMEEHTGDQNVSEVERYIVWPGQACAYKTGELALRAMREEAERELGNRFNLKRFHTTILEEGALPLDQLNGIVREWIASEKERRA